MLRGELEGHLSHEEIEAAVSRLGAIKEHIAVLRTNGGVIKNDEEWGGERAGKLLSVDGVARREELHNMSKTPGLDVTKRREVEIEPLALDANGALALQVGENVELHFQYDGKHNQLTLFVPLGTVTAPDAKAVYADMLRVNRFWRGTLGATLSLDDQEPPGAVLALRLGCAHLGSEDFQHAVERLIDAAHDWLPHLAGGSSGGGAPQPEADLAPHHFMMLRA
jgi:hypothetical protein